MSTRHVAQDLFNETKPAPVHRHNWDEKSYDDFDNCIITLYENMLLQGALAEKLLPVLKDIQRVARGNCQAQYDAVLVLHKMVLDYALEMKDQERNLRNNTVYTTFYWR